METDIADKARQEADMLGYDTLWSVEKDEAVTKLSLTFLQRKKPPPFPWKWQFDGKHYVHLPERLRAKGGRSAFLNAQSGWMAPGEFDLR